MSTPARPWVTPADVKGYSELPNVQNRSDVKLAVDITRAEEYVLNYTHNDFSEYDTIPAAVLTAIMLLAEMYGHNAVITSKTLKSESFDDYSYTSETSSITLEDTGVDMLLDPYVVTASKGRVTLKIRKI